MLDAGCRMLAHIRRYTYHVIKAPRTFLRHTPALFPAKKPAFFPALFAALFPAKNPAFISALFAVFVCNIIECLGKRKGLDRILRSNYRVIYDNMAEEIRE